MAHAKNNTDIDLDKTYEENVVGTRGIIYFGVGLFLLIVITFGLMWFLLDFMQEQKLAEDEQNVNPLALTKEEALPPEPRLQGAPGFGVGNKDDRINLELREPQAEYRVLYKQWQEQWEKGQKTVDENGKETIVTLPLKDAKEKLLKERAGDAANNKEGEKVLQESKTLVSDSSAGRMATGIRR